MNDRWLIIVMVLVLTSTVSVTMRLMMSRHRLVLLVLVCLVSTTSADDVTNLQPIMSHAATWQPTSWLRDLESMKICGAMVAGNNDLLEEKLKNQHMEAKLGQLSRQLMELEVNVSATRSVHTEQLTSCQLRVKSSRLEEENARLNQQVKHANEMMSLMVEKQAAIDETHRYKRQVEELNIALERVKSELRGEFTSQSERVKTELRIELTRECGRVQAKVQDDLKKQSERVKNEIRVEFTAKSERVKSELQQESLKKFEIIKQEIEECKNETTDFAETRDIVTTTRSKLDIIAEQFNDINNMLEPIKKRTKVIKDKVKELKMIQLGGSGNFYYFSNDTKKWHDAQKFCRSHGLELAAIETAQENTLIIDHKMKTYGNNDVWLGGTDEEHEGRWVWSGSQQNVTFTNWHSSQPNGGTKENCICIGDGSSAVTEWCDRQCNFENYFICETSVPIFT